MCLALPAKVVALPDPGMAVVSLEGVRKTISLRPRRGRGIGDYVHVHVAMRCTR